MRLSALSLALYAPADERYGEWSRDELEAMNAAYAAALERAFELGLESRASAAGQVRLPATLGPRWATPLNSILLRSPASGETVFVARG
jgi:hypothetical protein